VAEQVLRQGIVMTPRWSNCSGKHAGMLAMALHHDWPLDGYERREHPLQQRIIAEVARWSGCAGESLQLGIDGCTVVCFGLPIRAMAVAYARFAASEEPAAVRLRESMAAFPELTAGQGRLETELGVATAGLVIAKVGADGIYCAALPHAELGIALKVHDGDMRSSGPSLLAVLRDLGRRFDLGFDAQQLAPEVMRHAELPTVNTRGTVTGVTRVRGTLRF
jgi:L-asparaginase II